MPRKYQLFFSLKFSFLKCFFLNIIYSFFFLHEYLLHRFFNYKIIKHKPKNNNNVKNIVLFEIPPSSFVAKKREITGDVLSKVHPIPKGRVLKTICCSNIPKFVPKNIDSKNLF